MHRITTALVALLAPVFPSYAQETVEPFPFVISAEDSGGLEELRWVSRPLVIFADAAADPRFAEQLKLLAVDPSLLAERDVVVITDTDPKAKSALRTELRPRGFMIVLLAKDGTVVFRKPLPWDLREITHAIDKLPLRKQELTI